MSRRVVLRSLWAVASLGGGIGLAYSLFGESDSRALYLPGKTTHGHHQIELQCESCHTTAFADSASVQTACEKCHEGELRDAHDSHPKAKFLDPRNADRVAELDARRCATCHAEHVPEATRAMAVTLPEDYCFRCHEDIARERPSHEGLAFSSCDDAGCHNFHDNRALYEDFLAQHLDEPELKPELLPPPVARRERGSPMGSEAFDAPRDVLAAMDGAAKLADTVHAKAGVNCSDCHGNWNRAPALETCGRCHEAELGEFRLGRHGMRTMLGLSPMTVAQAEIPMRDDARGKALGCTSCHGAHEFDTRRASSEACQSCHFDEHTRNYASSAHGRSFRRELDGELASGEGVSCATCHLPRIAHDDGQTFADHNQNANLRPSEKMVRDVCMRCHGLRFTLDSLADPELVRANFDGRPKVSVASLDFVARRIQQDRPSAGSPAH